MMEIRVLLIEDNPGDARLVEECLKESAPDVAFEHVASLGAGLDRLAGHDVEAILLDLSLPDAKGLPALVRLKEQFPTIPIVILTGLKDEATALRAMRHGAQDYLVKGHLDGSMVVRALRFAIERMRAINSGDTGLRAAASELRAHLDLMRAEHVALERLIEHQPSSPVALPRPAAPGVTLQKRYLLRTLLGKGSYGQAFLARDEALGRQVVVKVLNDSYLPESEGERLFVKEARLLASLEHPHVIRVYDFGFSGPMPFYVMEYAEGGSLAQLAARGVILVDEALRLMDQILQGLEYVHAHGVLHRDLKPGNILLNERQEAKIGDFGMALLHAGPDATSTNLASTGGTPAYAAPEAFHAQPLTPASDLYAVGAVFFELLVREPYAESAKKGAVTPRRRLQAALSEHPDGDALARLILSTLEKRPERRPQSAAELREKLRAARP